MKKSNVSHTATEGMFAILGLGLIGLAIRFAMECEKVEKDDPTENSIYEKIMGEKKNFEDLTLEELNAYEMKLAEKKNYSLAAAVKEFIELKEAKDKAKSKKKPTKAKQKKQTT